MGGLSRRAYLLKNIQQKETKPTLLIDAGAMLFPQPFVAPSLFPSKEVQAKGIIESMSKMNYSAFGIAPQDLAAGTNFLFNQQNTSYLPWLSMNLVQDDGKTLVLPPYTIINAGEVSVAIMGLTGLQSNPANKNSAKFKTIPWEDALTRTFALIESQADMVILLSSYSEQINKQIVDRFPGIHIIFQSGFANENKFPQIYGNTLFAHTGKRGKYIGRLDIDWKPLKEWKQNSNTLFKTNKDRIDRINWQIGRLEKRSASGDLKNNSHYKQLQLEKAKLLASQTDLEKRQAVNQNQFSTFKNTFLSLPVAMQEDPEIKAIVARTKIDANNVNRKKFTNNQNKANSTSIDAFSQMAGWMECRSCHSKQVTFWKQTQHAHAWETLVQKNQHFNPECLLCHVTLPTYDRESVLDQNLLANLQPEFKTIGCETCHGPARNHSSAPERFRPKKPSEKTCLICHTPERDDNFIYSEKLAKIRCPASKH